MRVKILSEKLFTQSIIQLISSPVYLILCYITWHCRIYASMKCSLIYYIFQSTRYLWRQHMHLTAFILFSLCAIKFSYNLLILNYTHTIYTFTHSTEISSTWRVVILSLYLLIYCNIRDISKHLSDILHLCVRIPRCNVYIKLQLFMYYYRNLVFHNYMTEHDWLLS
jgi:hypothetical protein